MIIFLFCFRTIVVLSYCLLTLSYNSALIRAAAILPINSELLNNSYKTNNLLSTMYKKHIMTDQV